MFEEKLDEIISNFDVLFSDIEIDTLIFINENYKKYVNNGEEGIMIEDESLKIEGMDVRENVKFLEY